MLGVGAGRSGVWVLEVDWARAVWIMCWGSCYMYWVKDSIWAPGLGLGW